MLRALTRFCNRFFSIYPTATIGDWRRALHGKPWPPGLLSVATRAAFDPHEHDVVGVRILWRATLDGVELAGELQDGGPPDDWRVEEVLAGIGAEIRRRAAEAGERGPFDDDWPACARAWQQALDGLDAAARPAGLVRIAAAPHFAGFLAGEVGVRIAYTAALDGAGFDGAMVVTDDPEPWYVAEVLEILGLEISERARPSSAPPPARPASGSRP